MRQRGSQARSRDDETNPGAGPDTRPPAPRMTPPRSSRGAGYWPAIAIIAIVVATAGWTTVAVMALNQSSPEAAVQSQEPLSSDDSLSSFDDTGANASDANSSDAPVDDSHDVPELEKLLPTQIAGVALTAQSWTGDSLLSDGDPWSDSITKFLTSVGKTPTDLTAAQAFDSTESTDNSVGVFRLAGIATDKLRDAMIAAWKDSYPEIVVSTVKLDGTEVTKGDFGQDAINSYWFIKDDVVYDIETSDEAVATTMVKGIRDGTLPTQSGGAPASAPAGSGAPAASPSAS